MVRSTALALLLLGATVPPSMAQTPEIHLNVTQGPGPLDVTLQWTGGLGPFEVLRSTSPATVCDPGSLLGTTDVGVWIDTPPSGTFFYQVRSPFSLEPPEVCNGIDDDCDGTVDNQATGCNAGACQACVDGTCKSICGACDNCVAGACQTRCGACEVCAGGVCTVCSSSACQTCSNGACVSTCDDTQCQACVGGGLCASTCQTCETCVGGTCFDACDRSQCQSCQSGTCKSFCDPVCQVCGPQGCLDTCGPCMRCANGACLSRCDANACEQCLNGQCASRCTPDETCESGVCVPGGV